MFMYGTPGIGPCSAKSFLPAAKPAGLCFANVNLLWDYLVSGCSSSCASGCVSYGGYADGCVIQEGDQYHS